jgi:hypothetical protein
LGGANESMRINQAGPVMPRNVAWSLTLYATLLLLHGVHVFEEATTGFGLIERLGFWPWFQANLSLFALATIPAWYYWFSHDLMRRLLVLYGTIMLLNGTAHVGSALFNRSYDSGSASGVGLAIVGALLAFSFYPKSRAAEQAVEPAVE